MIVGGTGLWLALTIPVVAKSNHTTIEVVMPVIGGIVNAIIGIAHLLLGSAINQHKNWGRIAGIIYGALALFGFPIGTSIGGFILYWLIKQWDETVEPKPEGDVAKSAAP